MKKKEMEFDEIKRKLIVKSLENTKEELVPKERRKGEDNLLKIVNLLSFLVWGILFVVIAIIDKAGRGLAYIKYQDLFWASSSFWREHLLETALTVTIICIAVCTISVILNFMRHRRRTDRIKRSIILCELLTFIVGIFLIFKLY